MSDTSATNEDKRLGIDGDSGSEPIRADLWGVIEPAVQAVRRRVQQMLTSGQHVSRVNVPAFRVNEAGWPATVDSEQITAGDGPVDFRYLLVHSATELSDLPEVEAAVAFITNDPALAYRISIPSQGWNGSPKLDRIEADVLFLIADVAGRAEALDCNDTRSVRAIYSERERSILCDDFGCDLIVPLLLVRFPQIEEASLGNGVSLVRLDEATQRARARSIHWSPNPYLAAAATHALRIESVSIHADHWLKLLGEGWWQDQIDFDLIDATCQAIDISTGVPVGYTEVLAIPHDWALDWTHALPPVHPVATLKRYPEHYEHTGWNRPGSTVHAPTMDVAKNVLSNLRSGDKRINLAARRLFQSNLRTIDEDVIVDACIGIETLIGQGSELSHRISLRAAAVLAADGNDPVIAYGLVKALYEERSKIVHGSPRKRLTLKVGGSERPIDQVAVTILRSLLKSATVGKQSWSIEDLDAQILGALRSFDRASRAQDSKGH